MTQMTLQLPSSDRDGTQKLQLQFALIRFQRDANCELLRLTDLNVFPSAAAVSLSHPLHEISNSFI
jgi:hypothetical protein